MPKGLGSVQTKSKGISTITIKLRIVGFLFLLPAVILVLFCMIIPVCWNLILSFCSWNGLNKFKLVGFSNYTALLADHATKTAIYNSIIIALVSTAVAMILGIAFALMIYKVSKLEGTIFRFIFYSPAMLPMTVVGLLFSFILATDQGLLNNLLKVVGLGSLTHSWLASKGTVLYAIAAVQGWRFSGTIMMLVFTAIVALPESLFESAKLDGATYWKEVRYIILPIVKPTITLALSMMCMWAFKTYDIVAAMTGGGPGSLSKTAPLRIIEQAFSFNKYGYASAISIVFGIIIIILIAAIRRILRGETYEY